ncbi:hypothetical protein G6L13_05430 [Agrobacterium tumefaciens]|uniref:hypothetical protein n=1 Tax=Agrobacterium tumefaciens TaxID=358 RepID=UPI0015739CBD|nr:hypothetical protein [Agrobacterium tumefaciens]NTA79926.1 hypothetical protein [Agrobacterium tumefaciens]
MADSRPTERAMKAAVEMEMHAAVGTRTVDKGATLDKCFPAYDDLLEATKETLRLFRYNVEDAADAADFAADVEIKLEAAIAKAGA